jgi:hypothetical protein
LGVLKRQLTDHTHAATEALKANALTVALTRQHVASVLKSNWGDVKTTPCCEPTTFCDLDPIPVVERIKVTGFLNDMPKQPTIFKFSQYRLKTTAANWIMVVANPAIKKPVNRFSVRIDRMEKQGNGWDVSIGVTTEKQDRCDGTALVGYNQHSWGMVATGQKMYDGESYPYGEILNEGDVITVMLNHQNSELEFFVNGESRGVAFRNLPLHQPIYPAISSICKDFRFTME